MSRPNRPPEMAAQAATIAKLCILILWSMFIVTVTLYISVLTRSAGAKARLMAGFTGQISWREGLWTAATLIPASRKGGLPPVKHTRFY